MKNNDKEINSDLIEWFMTINQERLGPYHLTDLKKEPQFTPDTLVWRKGFQNWIQARFVPELQLLFQDELPSKPLEEIKQEQNLESDMSQQATLTLQQDPYQFLLWTLILLLVIFYTFYRLYYQF